MISCMTDKIYTGAPKADYFAAMDSRNVTDDLKGLTNDEIRAVLDTRRTDMVSIMMNLTQDFNKASALRNHNFFSGRKFVFINRRNNQNLDAPGGVKKFDKRGAVGTSHYEHIEHYHEGEYSALFEELKQDGYTIYAVDNIDRHEPVSAYTEAFPAKSAFLYGEEGFGLSDAMIAACDRMVYIPGTGSVRSLNVAVAHGIITALYTSQHTS